MVFLGTLTLWNAELAAEEFVLVSAGTFQMGSESNEVHRLPDETAHSVTLTRDFYLGKTEVSWTTWNRVRDWAIQNGYNDLGMGTNGFRAPEGEVHPVVGVTWWDAIQWCNARSEMEGKTPVYYSDPSFTSASVVRTGYPWVYFNREVDGYRLPTEAEWEYASRAGSDGAEKNLLDQGWFKENAEKNTHPGGIKEPNALGLFDMPGNAWEWCWDWYGEYELETVRDPIGPSEGTTRIVRGGCWMNPAHFGRPAYRHSLATGTFFFTIGFRVAQNSKSLD